LREIIGKLGKTGTKGPGTRERTTYAKPCEFIFLGGLDRGRDFGTEGLRDWGSGVRDQKDRERGNKGARDQGLRNGRVAELVWGIGWIPVNALCDCDPDPTPG